MPEFVAATEIASCSPSPLVGRASRLGEQRELRREGRGVPRPRSTHPARVDTAERLPPHLLVPLQRGSRVGIGFLPLNAPVAQFVERNLAAGNGAADEIPRHEDLEIPVEIAEPRLAAAPGNVDRTI